MTAQNDNITNVRVRVSLGDSGGGCFRFVLTLVGVLSSIDSMALLSICTF